MTVTHGTRWSYVSGRCRQECCASVHRAYMKRFREARRTAGMLPSQRLSRINALMADILIDLPRPVPIKTLREIEQLSRVSHHAPPVDA